MYTLKRFKTSETLTASCILFNNQRLNADFGIRWPKFVVFPCYDFVAA